MRLIDYAGDDEAYHNTPTAEVASCDGRELRRQQRETKKKTKRQPKRLSIYPLTASYNLVPSLTLIQFVGSHSSFPQPPPSLLHLLNPEHGYKVSKVDCRQRFSKNIMI